MNKHTPIPWELTDQVAHPFTFDDECNIYPPDASRTGGYQHSGPIAVVAIGECGTANANFIVKAVNSHDQLVEALKYVIDEDAQSLARPKVFAALKAAGEEI